MEKLIRSILSKLPAEALAYVEHMTATDPLQKFMFGLDFYNFKINGVTETDHNSSLGFQKVSGLKADQNAVDYHEGCSNFPSKLLGKVSFGEVTLERGMTPYNTDYSEDAASGSITDAGEALAKTTNLLDFFAFSASDSTARFDVDINILGRDASIKATYTLHNAFVSSWEASDLDASSDDVCIEKVVLQYDYPTYTDASGTGTARIWTPYSADGVTGYKDYS